MGIERRARNYEKLILILYHEKKIIQKSKNMKEMNIYKFVRLLLRLELDEIIDWLLKEIEKNDTNDLFLLVIGPKNSINDEFYEKKSNEMSRIRGKVYNLERSIGLLSKKMEENFKNLKEIIINNKKS